MSDTEETKYEAREQPKVAKAVSSDDSSDDESEEIIETGDVSENTSSSTNSKSEAGVVDVADDDDTETDSEEDMIEKEEAVVGNDEKTATEAPQEAEISQQQPKKAMMESVSSSGTEEESVKEETGFMKSKVQAREYDDEDNFDDMLADIPQSESPIPVPAEEEPVEPMAEHKPEVQEEEEEEEVSVDHTKSPSPVPSASPVQDRSRSPTPERKDSRGSHGSSSYDDERASSMSPEPPKVIAAPKVLSPTSPVSPLTSQAKSPITKIYTDKLATDSDGEESSPGKVARQKPASDITQIYTQKLAQSDQSPKPERAKFVRPSRDITQLYTAALTPKDYSPSRANEIPRRTGDITKLYTGGLGSDKEFKGKPNDERTNPTKHNMKTSFDKDAIKEAYTEVMADNNGIEWATFIFKDNKLGVTAKGSQFNEFKSQFGADDRGFGYIKIMTGDEMSKRSKFVMVTWVGPNVSVMKKAKMSTDKALMKDIIQNLSVELQCENANELSMDRFKTEVDRAGGAKYGTGVRGDN